MPNYMVMNLTTAFLPYFLTGIVLKDGLQGIQELANVP